jgi:hypothetical protein
MKKTILFLALITLVYTANSQDYTTGIGFRFGGPSGISVKHFIKSNDAIEGIIGGAMYHYGGFYLAGLYERHMSIDVKNLRLYYGGGAHFASWSNYRGYYNNGNASVGVDGIIGLEYVFPDLPINMSLDFKPAYDIYWGLLGDFGLSIRYNLK